MKKPENDTKQSWKDQYAKIAGKEGSSQTEHCFHFDPVEQAKSIGYSEQEIASVPEGVVIGMGCGNPTASAVLGIGEIVLDIGCGAGFDAFLAARKVGNKGKVIGLDMTPEMIQRAIENSNKGSYSNVEFKVAEIEHLSVESACIDVAISNCVLNHCPDKLAIFKEILRVLREYFATVTFFVRH